MAPAAGDIVLISDHDSTEGSIAPLAAATEIVTGRAPLCVDACHFSARGAGVLRHDDRGDLTMEVPGEGIRARPSTVLVYDIAPERRSDFACFQHALRRSGLAPFDDVTSWRNATDKERTVDCFRRAGIAHMETITMHRPDLAAAEHCYVALGAAVWTRPTTGKGGCGVFCVTSHEQLRAAVAHYARRGQAWQMMRDAENVDAAGRRHGYRVIVLRGRALVAVEHVQAEARRPCNEAQGAISRQLDLRELPAGLAELAIAATRSVGLPFAGVDLATARVEQGRRGVVFEVNVHPVIARHRETVAIPWVRAQIAGPRI